MRVGILQGPCSMIFNEGWTAVDTVEVMNSANSMVHRIPRWKTCFVCLHIST
jgi:hypothetical protein